MAGPSHTQASIASRWPRSNWPGGSRRPARTYVRMRTNEGANFRSLPRSDRSGVRPGEFVYDLDRVHGRVCEHFEHLRRSVRPENPCGALQFGRPRMVRAKVVADSLATFERMLRSPKVGRNLVRSVRRAFGQRALVRFAHSFHLLSSSLAYASLYAYAHIRKGRTHMFTQCLHIARSLYVAYVRV